LPATEQELFDTHFALAATGQRESIDHQFRVGSDLAWTFSYLPVRSEVPPHPIIAIWFMASDMTSPIHAKHLLYRHDELVQKELKERAAALDQQRAQLMVILDLMHDGVVFFDHRKRVLDYLNPAFAGLLGTSVAYLAGATRLDLRDFVAESDREWKLIRKAIFRAIRADVPWTGIIKIRRSDDTFISTHVTVTRGRGLYSPNGIVIVMRDMSEEQRQKEMHDRFIANAAHEIRTPITALKLRTHLLRSQSANFEKHLAHIEAAVDHLTRLTEDMLDKTRFETGRVPLALADVDLNELLQELAQVYEPVAEQKHITLMTRVLDRPVIAPVDRSQLRQAVVNLLTNALNYTLPGGTVTLSVSEMVNAMPDSETGAQFEAGSIERKAFQLHIEDTGVGIDPSEIRFIFEPFFRIRKETQPKGHGLGLTIVKEIVESHGGQISVESKVGVGSRFTITLFS
jgi:signal transduction histidine kinase